MADKEWFTADELAGKAGMPGDRSNVNRRANREGWKRRQKEGVKGKAFEFHLSSLPPETQEALGKHISTGTKEVDAEALAKIIEAVEVLLESRAKKIPAATKAKIICILYKASKSSNFIDLELVKNTLDLVA
ncbi:DNA-binding protein [Salmonella enterica subsp. enterica serovar Carmel]|nr:DNA-binding protein [Salmonella enterica subsp. enterica serovar Carmel]